MSRTLEEIQRGLDDVKKTLLNIFYEGIEIAPWGGTKKEEVSDKQKTDYLKLAFNTFPTSAQLVYTYFVNHSRTAIMASANGTGKSFWVTGQEFHASLTTFRPFMTNLEDILKNIMRTESEFLVFDLTKDEFRFYSKINKQYKYNLPLEGLADLWHTEKVPKFDDLKLPVYLENGEQDVEYFRMRVGRIMARDLQHVAKKTITPLIRQWCAPWISRSVRNPQGIYTTWEFEFNKEHSEMDVVSAINPDPNILEGWEGQVFQMEEPIPRDPYIRTIRGARSVYGFKCLGALTPISDPWMFHDLKRNADGKDISWLEADWTTNKHNLNPDYYRNMRAALTKDEIEARLYGRFSFLLGLVFPEFQRDMHVLKEEDWYPPANWGRYRAIDVHSLRKPQAILYVAISPHNKKYIYHEIWDYLTMDEMVKALKEYEDYEISKGVQYVPSLDTDPEYAYNTIYWSSWIDPIASTIEIQTGCCLMEQLEKRGIHNLEPGSKDVTTRTKIIKQLLEDNTLFVAKECSETIRNFESYSMKPDRPDVSDATLNKPRDKDNDMMENLGRILIVEPRWVEPKHRDRPGAFAKMVGGTGYYE